jgi:hypothetical protein
VLELSRLETEKDRGKCASMMLEFQSSVASISPKLDVLGFVKGMLGMKVTTYPRNCPLTGAIECDPNIEEKDPDIDPSLCFPSDAHSPDAISQSKDFGDVKTPEGNNDTDESLDSDLTKLLEGSELPLSSTNIPVSSSLSPPLEMSSTPPPVHEKKAGEDNRERARSILL